MLDIIWTQADTWQQVITTHAGDQKNHFTALFSLMEGCVSSQRVIDYFSAVSFVVQGNPSKDWRTQGAQVFSKLSLVVRGQKARPKNLTKT